MTGNVTQERMSNRETNRPGTGGRGVGDSLQIPLLATPPVAKTIPNFWSSVPVVSAFGELTFAKRASAWSFANASPIPLSKIDEWFNN